MSRTSSTPELIIAEENTSDSALGTITSDDEVVKTRRIPEDPFGSESETEDASDASYSVEAIIGHRVRKGELQFKVRWDGYEESEATYEPERNLQKSANLVHQYLDDYNKTATPEKTLKTSLIDSIGRGGSSGTRKTNTDLWITFGEIKEFVETYRKKEAYKDSESAIEKFSSTLEKGRIYVDLFRDHFFVIKPETNYIYLADANNLFINNNTIKKELSNRYGVPIQPIEVKNLAKMDECGGFAALIILEFLRPRIDIPIRIPTYLVSRVRAKDHQGSKPAVSRSEYQLEIEKKFWVQCPKCPKKC